MEDEKKFIDTFVKFYNEDILKMLHKSKKITLLHMAVELNKPFLL